MESKRCGEDACSVVTGDLTLGADDATGVEDVEDAGTVFAVLRLKANFGFGADETLSSSSEFSIPFKNYST